MEWSGPIGLLLATTLCVVNSMPPVTTTTTRSTPPIGNATNNKMVIHLGDNSASMDVVLDTRTPPKIKQQVEDKMREKDEFENSHAGVAIPIDADSLEMEETTKKLNFYKIERPTATTNSGLSTWILLSGQTSATTRQPPTRKPLIKHTSEEKAPQNLTILASEKPTRIVKPIFKQRPTTTAKPSTTSKPSTTTTVKSTTRLTKIKASVLNKKTNTSTESTTKKSQTVANTTTDRPNSSTHLIIKKNMTTESTTVAASNSSTLPLESKTDEIDLPNIDNKKKKTNKRKKNKTRRRKPEDKNSNSTSVSKPTKIFKEKPISTQLYNYLAREVMPTVGVGLVGLMVTAGLASYFLYPFGAARRNYDIDRKDKEGSYYYSDDYSNGIPEEEAIGKVIAGMPGNSLLANSYKNPTQATKNTYLNPKYRLADRTAQIQEPYYGGMVQGTVENVPLSSVNQEDQVTYDKQSYQSDNYEPISYSTDLDSKYTPNSDKKFVVGNIPKEVITEVTPAAVPEHGPRNINFDPNFVQEPTFVVGSIPRELTQDITQGTVPVQRPRNLKIRRKRSDFPNDIDNEIVTGQDKIDMTTRSYPDESQLTEGTTVSVTDVSPSNTEKIETSTISTQTTTSLPDKINSFIDLMKELIHFKAKIGLQMIQNVTQSISKYISRVQTRLDEHYRDYSKNKH